MSEVAEREIKSITHVVYKMVILVTVGRLSFRALEQNAGISRRQNRLVEVWMNPVDTHKKIWIIVCTPSQFLRSMYFSKVLFLLHLKYELKPYGPHKIAIFFWHRKKMQIIFYIQIRKHCIHDFWKKNIKICSIRIFFWD